MSIYQNRLLFNYSDLACERRRADTAVCGVEYSKNQTASGSWERIRITTPEGEKSIGRPIGIYNTLHLERIDKIDISHIDTVINELAAEIKSIVKHMKTPCNRILTVGLGNSKLTPDSLGVECADEVNATMHIKAENEEVFKRLKCAEIAVIKPGVCAESGMDAVHSVRGICKSISADLVIAIDALAAGAKERLGSTIQLSNTGIHPGSGIGAQKQAMNQGTLSVPVLSIGVPTVINSRMFESDKSLPDDEVGADDDLFVCPKDINRIIAVAARIIGGAINRAFGVQL